MFSLRIVNKIGFQVAGLLMVTVLIVACTGQAETERGFSLAIAGKDLRFVVFGVQYGPSDQNHFVHCGHYDVA